MSRTAVLTNEMWARIKPLLPPTKPDDHGIGRSCGGLTTKTHALVDGKGRALVLIISPGQAGDSPALPKLLAHRRTPRGHRAMLRKRGITTVIPEPADQA